MKKIVLLAATLVVMIACKNNEENKSEGADTFVEAITHDEEASYETFGDKIVAEKAFTKEEMLEKYENLKPGDTLNIKFKSTIKDVCQKKGCWMAMELPDEKESFVKFKDYGFFVPLNAAEQEAVVSGKAFVSEISVAELKHYAKDGGKSQEEIDKITEPEITYGFMADGVLIKK
ncbi:DUF4920 domain-containing protein [Flavobacterium salilacus subsp. salilacus]|uniref:DUF4920 domain-containing protein n=1 Tax=Flavobacterium TaxID=237 RepID=UPI001074BE54|nr:MULTISPECIES: DUF4920 domain-containing protein [Flavobacterium]KAF2518415.1 DUF4920 domain-containing protein [Flavobacterium salilacus subsp. salilacus]MBE1615051.1 DUF4920 domain-containing protein [Flavobacterium sp. SaA2.13]